MKKFDKIDVLLLLICIITYLITAGAITLFVFILIDAISQKIIFNIIMSCCGILAFLFIALTPIVGIIIDKIKGGKKDGKRNSHRIQ